MYVAVVISPKQRVVEHAGDAEPHTQTKNPAYIFRAIELQMAVECIATARSLQPCIIPVLISSGHEFRIRIRLAVCSINPSLIARSDGIKVLSCG